MRVVQSPHRRYFKYANIVRSGDVVDVTLHIRKAEQTIENIGDGKYIVLATGEVREFSVNGTTKADSLELVRESVRALVQVINANACNVKDRGLWCGLTYRENMRDLRKLYVDLKDFWRKVRKEYGSVEYIVAVEPQERGAWHAHVLMWSKAQCLYIPKKRLEELWGHGFCKVVRVQGVDNIGAYLSAYLTNIKDGEKTKKGARLHLYPKGMRIWRCSRGVDRPEFLEWEPPQKIRDVVGDATPTYAPPSVDLLDDNGQLVNSIQHLQYNMARISAHPHQKGPSIVGVSQSIPASLPASRGVQAPPVSRCYLGPQEYPDNAVRELPFAERPQTRQAADAPGRGYADGDCASFSACVPWMAIDPWGREYEPIDDAAMLPYNLQQEGGASDGG